MCVSSDVTMSASSRSCIVVVALVFIYVVYLLIGASVFSTLEKPLEEKVRAEMFLLKQELINNTSCINISTLDRLLEKLINANKYGVSLVQNTSENSNWDLASALFFSNTLVTTIGELKVQVHQCTRQHCVWCLEFDKQKKEKLTKTMKTAGE